MSNILLLGSGTQALSFARVLKRIRHKVFLLSEEKGNYADKSRYVSKIICLPTNSLDENCLSILVGIIKENSIDTIIPMGDDSAQFISRYLAIVQSVASVKMPQLDNFFRGYDKNQLMRLCAQSGYPHPTTIDLDEISLDSEAVKTFHFPAILKPNQTTGGRGMVKIESYEELLEKYDGLHKSYGGYHLQEYIHPGGRQLKVQLYIDENKNLIQSSVMQKVRWYPVEAGSSCCAVSVYESSIVDVCYSILKDIDWVGFADFDVIENPKTKELLVMEINPRVPACIELPIAAGINWAEVIVNGYMNLPQKTYSYKEGVALRHIGLDFLWFCKSKSRWTTKPSWFKFIGHDIHYQDISDWSDPLPFISGTWNNIKKLFNPAFKETKGIK